MTLTTVIFAWLPVAILFLLAARLLRGRPNGRAVAVSLAESLVLTLLAGLWFGSLGHGGWPVLFLLIGLLVAGAERGLRSAFLRSEERPDWRGFLGDLVRYLAAGGLLAWRLG